jgi:hypothetical protein
MLNLIRSAAARRSSLRLRRAVCETLESRRMLSGPQVAPAGQRLDRPDYVAPTTGGTIVSASEQFQWEYSGPRLVYDFDQPVQGVSLSTHTLTTLYAQRQRSNPYPLTNVPVTINDSGYENDDFTPKLNSTNSGVSWSKTTTSGTTILLESDGARPNFKLRISTATGSQQWSFKWDGFERVTDVTSIDTTGDGENLYLLSMGSSGWVTGNSAASGTVIAPPDISLSQSGNTATFNLPNGLADGYYDVVMPSDGITNSDGQKLDADPAALGNQDYRYSFSSFGGDANGDRVVDGTDLFVIDSNVGTSGVGFSRGDFNYDGVVDNADYSIINFNYGTILPLPVTQPNTLTASSAFAPRSIRLQWLPPANETISGFRIWRSTDGVNYELLSDVIPANQWTWDDNSMGDGAKRTYRVRAFKTLANDAIEYSPATNKAWAVTNLPGPGEVSATASGDGVNLNFTDNTNDETGFEVWQSTSGGGYVLVDTLPANAEQGPMVVRRSGLNPGATYSFRVRAKSAAQSSIFTLRETVTMPNPTRSIAVQNASFEQPALANGDSESPIPDWTFSTTSVEGSGIVVNPDSSTEWNTAAAQGQNIAWLTTSNTDYGDATIAQTLSETLQANTTYRLRFAVGALDGFEVGVQLFAGGVELPMTYESYEVTSVGWYYYSYAYDSGTEPAQEGEPLEIRLTGSGTDAMPAPGIRVAFDDVSLTATVEADGQTPRGGTSWSVPGVIEFEDFDDGGQNVSWLDTTEGNTGGEYRRDTDADVDVARDDTGSFIVGWAKAGEWLEYTIDVINAGSYDLTAYVSSPGDEGTFHWELDGNVIGGVDSSLEVQNSEGYFNYVPLTLPGVPFTAGEHVLRLKLDTAGSNDDGWASVANFNYFTLSQTNGNLSNPMGLAATAPYSNRVDLSWTNDDNNAVSFNVQRSGDNGDTWTTIKIGLRAGTNFYADTTAAGGTSLYRVFALGAGGDTLGSNIASVWVPPASDRPTVDQPWMINFQVDRTIPVPGYLIDSGDLFGARGNGLTYGWNIDHTIQDRERGINADRRRDTLVHFRQGGEWSINLPDDTYDVTVGIGDAGWASTYTLNVNGVSYWNNLALAKNTFQQKMMTITVTDGKIVLDAGASADRSTKINYIEIASGMLVGELPVATITASNMDADEAGPISVTYTVRLDRPAPANFAVAFEVDTTASTAEVQDYLLQPTASVEFPIGAMQATITLTPQQDVDEEDELLVLRLLESSEYDLGTSFSALALIRDDDGAAGEVSADLDVFEDVNGDGIHDNSASAEQVEENQPTFIPTEGSLDRAKLALALRNVTSGQTVTFSFDEAELTLYTSETGAETFAANTPIPLSALGVTGPGTAILFVTATNPGPLTTAITLSISGSTATFDAFSGGITGANSEAFSVDTSGAYVALTWPATDGTTEYYEVFRSSTANFEPTYVNLVGEPTEAAFDDTDVVPGVTYYYQVYAANSSAAGIPVGSVAVILGNPTAPGTADDPANLRATGVNDLEVLLTWNVQNRVSRYPQYVIQESTDGTNWFNVAVAPPTARSWIVRGAGLGGNGFLQETSTYQFRVLGAFGEFSAVLGPASNVASASTLPPDVNINVGRDIIVIVGSRNWTLDMLLKGITINTSGSGNLLTGQTSKQNTMGMIWADLVNDGYNCFIVPDPEDGGSYDGGASGSYREFPNGERLYGVLNNDGSGRIYDEIMYEFEKGIGNLGLIGWSHGGGMTMNISNRLFLDSTLPLFSGVVFAATIDGINYGTGLDDFLNVDGAYVKSSMAVSPARAWGSYGFNYYEPNGVWYIPAPFMIGLPLVGATNYPPYTALNHENIGRNNAVLVAVENDVDQVYSSLIF